MSIVVVAGSDNNPFFAVIDFTDPQHPAVVRVPPDANHPFGGCCVAIDGSMVAVGDVQGRTARLIDVSRPSQPASVAFLDTELAGIATIAISGLFIALGELFTNSSALVLLIDFSVPAKPQVVGRALTPFTSTTANSAAISSLAFASPRVVIASNPIQPEILRIDFSNAAAPVLTKLTQTHFAGSPAIDAISGRIAAGDGEGSRVSIFDASSFAILDNMESRLSVVTSVAMSDTFVLAGSSSEPTIASIALNGGTVQTIQAQVGLGIVTAIDGQLGACGGSNSTIIRLVDLAATPAALSGQGANVQFEPTSLDMSIFPSVSPGNPGPGGGGATPPNGGTGGGLVPEPGHPPPPSRPLSVRGFMRAEGMDPAAGLRSHIPEGMGLFKFMTERPPRTPQ